MQLVTGAALVFAVVCTAGVARADLPPTELRAFKPEADTYVTAARPTTNFGSARVLRVARSHDATAYLRFRIKNLKGEIASVTLLLHAVAGARTRYQVRPIRRRNWEEDRLTYRNAPRPPDRYAASRPVRRAAWSAVDVTPFFTNGVERISLAITTRSRSGVVFASRESKHGPRLVVRTAEKGKDGQAS